MNGSVNQLILSIKGRGQPRGLKRTLIPRGFFRCSHIRRCHRFRSPPLKLNFVVGHQLCRTHLLYMFPFKRVTGQCPSIFKPLGRFPGQALNRHVVQHQISLNVCTTCLFDVCCLIHGPQAKTQAKGPLAGLSGSQELTLSHGIDLAKLQMSGGTLRQSKISIDPPPR